ncbi:CaiF/GrlA family transcriptional regulator, partial [Salmonella enterica]
MSSDKSKGKIVFSGNDIHYPGQTNHDACFIPVSVRQYAGEPLYIIVAHWCLLQQNWVQRNQIAEAFHITARRASYLIAYLRSKTSR